MFNFNDCEVFFHCFVVPKRLLDEVNEDFFKEEEDDEDEELTNE